MFKNKFIVTLFMVMLFAAPSVYALTSSHVIEHAGYDKKIAPVNNEDFTVTINGHKFSLDDRWDNEKISLAGKELDSNFVGDVEAGDVSYKFWQHNYNGYSIYSSNIYYDKEKRDIDEYVIAQISLDADQSSLTTMRGIKSGDALQDLLKKYGPGKEDDSDGEKWIEYEYQNKKISFQIEGSKVSNIIMVISVDG